MEVLIADQQLVTELYTMDRAIATMRDAFRMLDEGDVVMPLRSLLVLPGGQRVMGLMPSYAGALDAVGVKAVAAFPDNFGTEYDTHQGVVLFFDAQRGLLRAIVDATSITAIRTAAVSAVATGLLAREDARELAIIGAGTQAVAHLEAMSLVRPLQRARVFSVPHESAVAFAAAQSDRFGVPVEVAETAQAAVAGADIVCTVTTSPEPVLKGEWVSPGTHVNCVGAYSPTTREIDSDLMVKSRLYADRRESLTAEAGEFLIPRSEGLIGDDHVRGELSELLVGKAHGRTSAEQITLFKSLGVAIEDLASACFVYRTAQESRQGTWVEIGGRHFGTAAKG